MRPPAPESVLHPGAWTHRHISANGIRLHVAECGEGPLVVLLHGFPEYWFAWRHQLVGLAERGFRAVAVDLRGYGDSDKPPRGYDLWTLAGDIAGLVPALGESRAAVVGHGWGGVVGWTVAAVHPRRVSALVTIGAPHPLAIRRTVVRDRWGQARALSAVARFQLPRLPERDLRVDEGARVERIMRAWSGGAWGASDDFGEAVAHYRSAIRVPGVAHCAMEYYRWAVRSQLRAEGRRFATAVARPAELPVLGLHGADDPFLLPGTAAASRPWAGERYTLEVWPGAGHFPHEECPDAVTARVARFLGC
ncbi:MAG TPA: alpha/beta hydrolase [Pseudonocardia sp.]